MEGVVTVKIDDWRDTQWEKRETGEDAAAILEKAAGIAGALSIMHGDRRGFVSDGASIVAEMGRHVQGVTENVTD